MVLDGAGWLGGVAVAVAYVLVATRRLSPDARMFQVLNIIGGVLLTATTLYRQAVPNTVINVVWIVFGIYGIVTARRRQRADRQAPVEALAAYDVEPYPATSSATPELVEAR